MLKKYTLTHDDGKESTVLLSDEDAERYGDAAKPVERVTPMSTEDDAKARQPQNKARATNTK